MYLIHPLITKAIITNIIYRHPHCKILSRFEQK